MPDKLDAPFYTLLPDSRHIYICLMPGHSRYWLNVGAALWVCEACHPAVGTVEVKPVDEIVPGQPVEAKGE
jgi:hypothetical protein